MSRDRYIIEFQPEPQRPGEAPAAVLKLALRGFRLRCVGIREVEARPQSEQERVQRVEDPNGR